MDLYFLLDYRQYKTIKTIKSRLLGVQRYSPSKIIENKTIVDRFDCTIMAVMLLISGYIFTASQIGAFESCLVECTQFPSEHNNEFLVMNLNMLHGYPDFEHLSERSRSYRRASENYLTRIRYFAGSPLDQDYTQCREISC